MHHFNVALIAEKYWTWTWFYSYHIFYNSDNSCWPCQYNKIHFSGITLHTCLFVTSGRQFTKVARTMNNGSLVKTSPFFPNKQYGLNGRHLRIATLPVVIKLWGIVKVIHELYNEFKSESMTCVLFVLVIVATVC